MLFKIERAKQTQEVTFLRQTSKMIDSPPYFNNQTVKPTHTQKYFGLQLDNKLYFNEHTAIKLAR